MPVWSGQWPKLNKNAHFFILLTRMLGKLQTDLIDIRTKPDSKYVSILHLEDHFLKFNILYLLKKKKLSGINNYIRCFVRYWTMTEIFWCNNVWDFKETLFIFLQKNDIKLIGGRSWTPRTHRFVSKSILWWKVNIKNGKQSIIPDAKQID